MSKPTKPVVRVVIEVYPRRYGEGDERPMMLAAEEAAGYLYGKYDMDYLPPRVVGIKRVKRASK